MIIVDLKKMLNVICFGNLWQGDDGFGIHVFRRLCATGSLPHNVKSFDAGIAGLGAIDYFKNCRKVVIVDAIKSGNEIGSVHRFLLKDFALPDEEFSIHSVGVNHLLAFLPIFFESKTMPKIVIIGAEISEIDRFTEKLTPPLEVAIDKAIRLVQSECMN